MKFRYVWYAVTGFSVLSIIVACMTFKSYEEFMTNDIARKLHGTKAYSSKDEEVQTEGRQ
jgi:hypothetical protein